jgi:hypothetical protein
MSVWFCIPSIRPGGGTIPIWREMGYRVAVLRQGEPIDCEVQIPTGEYLGWAPSVNILAKWVVEHDRHAEWIVTGGDDYEPDRTISPDHIGQDCVDHFWRVNGHKADATPYDTTFGVMQPTGDRWGDTQLARRQYGENRGAYIDRIAGSPWFGREWVKCAYGGNGPMWGEYRHMYADEELLEVATKLGVYWPRRDLIQLHKHWGRKPGDEFATMADCPDFLMQVNTEQHWNESYQLFNERKAAGWPGHEPLLTSVSV